MNNKIYRLDKLLNLLVSEKKIDAQEYINSLGLTCQDEFNRYLKNFCCFEEEKIVILGRDSFQARKMKEEYILVDDVGEVEKGSYPIFIVGK